MIAASPASIAIGISGAFVAWMVLELLFLLRHRRAAERRAPIDARIEIAVTRDMLAAITEDTERCALKAFDAATPDERRRAARRLIQLVRGEDRARLLALCERARLFDQPLRLLDSALDVRRIEAVRELEMFGSPICIEALNRCLATDPSPAVRLRAAVALANLDWLPECRQLLIMVDLAGRPLTRMHAGLFRSIAGRDRDAIAALSCDDAFRRHRPMLVDALGWTGGFEGLPTLERHGRDPDPEVRCAALRAARRIGHPNVEAWVTALLLDPSEPVRVQAVRTCGELGLVDTVPILLSLVQSSSWWVRVRAEEALARLRAIGPGGVIPMAAAA